MYPSHSLKPSANIHITKSAGWRKLSTKFEWKAHWERRRESREEREEAKRKRKDEREKRKGGKRSSHSEYSRRDNRQNTEIESIKGTARHFLRGANHQV